MATTMDLRDALVQMVDTQNRVIAAKDAEIQQLRQQLQEAGLPDDQVPQADVGDSMRIVQDQQTRLEQILAEELEGESPEGEPVVIQPVVPEGETVFQPPEDTATGGEQVTEPAAGEPVTGDPASQTNTQPAPDDATAPPTEQQSGAVGSGGGTPQEPMT